jgi:preprotein translocase subunit YajC
MTLPALLVRIQEAVQQAPQVAPGATGEGATPPARTSNPLLDFLPLVAVVGIFYFVMIMPERKNRKRREAMLAALKKGDRVMTNGGMYATVAAINDQEVTLLIDEGVRARFSRAAIQSVVEEPGAADAAKK